MNSNNSNGRISASTIILLLLMAMSTMTFSMGLIILNEVKLDVREIKSGLNTHLREHPDKELDKRVTILEKEHD